MVLIEYSFSKNDGSNLRRSSYSEKYSVMTENRLFMLLDTTDLFIHLKIIHCFQYSISSVTSSRPSALCLFLNRSSNFMVRAQLFLTVWGRLGTFINAKNTNCKYKDKFATKESKDYVDDYTLCHAHVT